MIELADVTFRYPGAERPALAGVTLSLAPGEHVAVVGANGSGKSTLALLCDGMLLPEGGSVHVDGMDTRDAATAFEVRSRVGLVLQDPDDQIVGAVVEEDAAFGPENLGVPREELRARVDEALAAVGLAGLERREPHLLSEGQKQRLAIAGALAMRPAYLVLDEPAAMLDPRGREDVGAILGRLASGGTGILRVTHDLAEAAAARRVVALCDGSVAFDGLPADLLADALLMDRVGVAPPPLAALAEGLRLRGVDVRADAFTPAALLEALWR